MEFVIRKIEIGVAYIVMRNYACEIIALCCLRFPTFGLLLLPDHIPDRKLERYLRLKGKFEFPVKAFTVFQYESVEEKTFSEFNRQSMSCQQANPFFYLFSDYSRFQKKFSELFMLFYSKYILFFTDITQKEEWIFEYSQPNYSIQTINKIHTEFFINFIHRIRAVPEHQITEHDAFKYFEVPIIDDASLLGIKHFLSSDQRTDYLVECILKNCNSCVVPDVLRSLDLIHDCLVFTQNLTVRSSNLLIKAFTILFKSENSFVLIKSFRFLIENHCILTVETKFNAVIYEQLIANVHFEHFFTHWSSKVRVSFYRLLATLLDNKGSKKLKENLQKYAPSVTIQKSFLPLSRIDTSELERKRSLNKGKKTIYEAEFDNALREHRVLEYSVTLSRNSSRKSSRYKKLTCA